MLEKLHPSLYSSPNGCLQPVIMSSDLFRAMIANVPISHFEWDVLTSILEPFHPNFTFTNNITWGNSLFAVIFLDYVLDNDNKLSS